MFEYDICMCGNASSCPHKETCKRAQNHGPGIYTVSLFYEKNKECEYYLPIKKESKQNGKSLGQL